ncbi:UPF0692 protein C19orf54 X1 [Biomphalaria glabrata]|nr:UPF0692 protein C19orf54 X1 [Biomphalaria glabrata]
MSTRRFREFLFLRVRFVVITFFVFVGVVLTLLSCVLCCFLAQYWDAGSGGVKLVWSDGWVVPPWFRLSASSCDTDIKVCYVILTIT